MEEMNILAVLLIVAFAILQIILFFKIWGMTNDIREIKNKYLRSKNTINKEIRPADWHFSEGALVVNLKTEQQMRVTQKTADGKYKCYSGLVHIGDFGEDEIMEFEKWKNEVYKK